MNALSLRPAPFQARRQAWPVEPAAATYASSRAKVLLVNEDADERDRMIRYLENCGMYVTALSERQQIAPRLASWAPSLILLDLPPESEDLAVLRETRARSDAPVVMTIGGDLGEAERVVRLEAGADDCIVKPFSLRELLARMRAILRRRTDVGGSPRPDPGARGYRFAGWSLDCRMRRLTDPAGNPVVLTRSEYDLLVAFLDAPQRPLTREYLVQATRMHEDCLDRNIDVRVVRLRRKLDSDPDAPRLIGTERGVGYRLEVPVERTEAGRTFAARVAGAARA